MPVSPAQPPAGYRPDKFVGLLPPGSAGVPTSFIGAYLMDVETGQAIDFPHAGATADDWFLPWGCAGIGADAAPSTSANVVAWPFYFPRVVSPKTLRMRLVTHQAGAEAMAGIYSNANGRPADLLDDLGTKDLSAASPANVDWSVTGLSTSGWFWVLVWMKNVATQATVRRPTSASFAVNVPVVSSALEQNTNVGALYLVSAYPASMPASAPAVVPSTTFGYPLVVVQVA